MASKLFEIAENVSEPTKQVVLRVLEGIREDISQLGSSVQRPNAEISDFYRFCKNVIEKEQELNKTANRVFFREAFSPQDFGVDELKREFNIDNRPNDIVSVKIIRRTPGTLAKTNKPHDSKRREVVPHLRAVVQDEEYSGYLKYQYGQFFDNSIEFIIWSLNNQNADRTAFWLEQTMNKWRWYFRANGIDQVLYQGRGEDNSITESLTRYNSMIKDLKMVSRPLLYYVRTEDTYIVKEKELEQIFINISVSNN